MTKEYSVFDKKLQEIESEIQIALSLPQKTPLSNDLQKRLMFFKSMLFAEIESHPEKPQHLNHLTKRVEELEAACHDWDVSRDNAVNNFHPDSIGSYTDLCLNNDDYDDDGGEDLDVYEETEHGPKRKPEPVKTFNGLLKEEDSLLGVDKVGQSEGLGESSIKYVGADLDTDSTCSCSELCSSDDGEDVYEEPEPDSGAIKWFDGLVEEKDSPLGVQVKRLEKGENRICKYAGAMFGGVVFGATVMCYVMVRFSGCFSQVELVGYVAPT